MNAAHFHLAINHLPVAGLLFGLGVLVIGRLVRNDAAVKVGFWLLVASGVFSVPAYLSGEPAEEIIEHLIGVSDTLMERHEDAAKLAFGATLLSGCLAGGALFLSRSGRAISNAPFLVVLIVAGIAGGNMVWAAKLGGEIHHAEARSGIASNAAVEKDSGDDDDDD